MAPMMLEDDFIPTLSDSDAVSDEEMSAPEPPTQVASQLSTKRKREEKKAKGGAAKKRKQDSTTVDGQEIKTSSGDVVVEGGQDKDDDMLSDFEFDNSDRTAILGGFDGWDIGGKGGEEVDVISRIVARRRGGEIPNAAKTPSAPVGEEGGEEDSDVESDQDLDSEPDAEDDEEDATIGPDDDDESSATGEEHDEDVAAPVTHPDDAASDSGSDDNNEEDALEREKQRAFFAPAPDPQPTSTTGATDTTFTSMSLSRPILKGLSALNFTTPTPIQKKTIPIALSGQDIVGGAVTGSGKTAAFLLPILERLLYRPKRIPTTRVSILTPTRELALQCLSVGKRLAAFTDITFGRAIGGLNSREQERELALRPDIVVGTPGRYIDFLRNSPHFQTDTLEILVLDEADRMLETGFADELNEILKSIPQNRQTLLFSATMSSKVDDLIRAGLQRPVRILVDAQKTSAAGLVQEFVRLRPGRESKRLGYLLHLCTEVHRDRVIVFFRQKKEAHRVRVIFALLGLQAAELHGSMTQEQRMQAIESFRSGRAGFLLATDLASRGLDIRGIETVINYEAPQSHEIYLHRVGRTARAGRGGVSCTLAAEPDRKVVKAAVKAARGQKGAEVKQRTVEPGFADAWQSKIDDLADQVEAVMREEKEERVLEQSEREVRRAENFVQFEGEIMARPKRTWFESEKDKAEAKRRGGEVLNGAAPEGEKKRKGEGKLSNKRKKRLEDRDERRGEGMGWKKGKGDAKAAGAGGGKGPKGAGAGKAGKGGGKNGKGKGRR
ncbi:hypothetical protein B0A50_04804 [Salinomyces thailandicus]|uniref:RNA helicase n=1 Tax=Salinomyces thailandicus TaxID=706561 RepID=A0A4U0TXH7_9PEZI|nr:hypothetical protein B0A50_04804 [Salinomyces thailandica]